MFIKSLIKVVCCIVIAVVFSVVSMYVVSPPITNSQVVENVSIQPIKLTNVGLAPYAIRHEKFECLKFLNSINSLSTINISMLWDSFGNNNDCLLSLLNDPRMRSLEIALINECCIRNNDCAPNEFLYGMKKSDYEKRLVARDPKLLGKIREYFSQINLFLEVNLQPNTQCYVSPGLESNLSSKAFNVISSIAESSFPKCMIVANPLGGRGGYNADFREHHGTSTGKVPPCITNLDGTDIDFPQRRTVQPHNHIDVGKKLTSYIGKAARRCELSFLWVKEMNCYDTGKRYSGKRVPPLKRGCKSGKVFELVASEVAKAQRTPK